MVGWMCWNGFEDSSRGTAKRSGPFHQAGLGWSSNVAHAIHQFTYMDRPRRFIGSRLATMDFPEETDELLLPVCLVLANA